MVIRDGGELNPSRGSLGTALMIQERNPAEIRVRLFFHFVFCERCLPIKNVTLRDGDDPAIGRKSAARRAPLVRQLFDSED